jgi:hypothetical protein
LIGGSFFAGAPASDCEEPEPFESEPVSEPESVSELELDCVLAGVVLVFEPLLGAGVASGSTSGGSLEVEALDSEDELDVLAGVEDPDEGITTRSGERAEASVPETPWLATLPSSTPKPRNTATSSAETGRGGRLSPPDGCGAWPASAAGGGGGGGSADAGGYADDAVPACAAVSADDAAPMGDSSTPCALLRSCRSSSSSCSLRGPTRSPHARQ